MSAPKTLSARPRALTALIMRFLTAAALPGVVCVLLAAGSAPGQSPGGVAPRAAASRLKSGPETIGTPPGVQTAPLTQSMQSPSGQPMYEFESGGVMTEGEIFDDGAGGPIFGDGYSDGEFYDEAVMYGDGYGRYGGVGRYGCSPVLQHGCGLHNFYFRADYLLWWGKGFAAPPLVTASPSGTSFANAGELSQPGTSILFPGDSIADSSQSGGRGRLGYWFDPCDTMAVEATYFAIGQASSSFYGDGGGYPILARPFVNVTPGQLGHDAVVVAYPGLYAGSVNAVGTSNLQGVEVQLRHVITRGCDWRLDWLLGWRYNRLDDDLRITAQRTYLGSPTAPLSNTSFDGWDEFSTQNYFNGVQIGVITEVKKNRWWFETRTTLALGNNRAIVTIDGQTTTSTPVPGAGVSTDTFPGGLLAQPTNMGRFYNDDFAIVPQVGANLGFELCGGLWATVGYNFMYWSRVARPGDQIDLDVNLSQQGGEDLMGLARPSFTGLTTDYWAQGLNFGLAYRY